MDNEPTKGQDFQKCTGDLGKLRSLMKMPSLDNLVQLQREKMSALLILGLAPLQFYL